MTRVAIDIGQTLDVQLEQLETAVASQNSDHELLELPGGGLGFVRTRRGKLTYQELNEDALNAFLMRWVVPMKTDAKGNTSAETSLSRGLVRAYTGMGQWDGVPAVTRMAAAPVVRPDLSVRWNDGYDQPSETFITESIEPPKVMNEPLTLETIQYSVDYLMKWFDPFAFEHESSRADCLALALTPMLLSYIPDDTVPGGLFLANRPGSGKTQLAQLIGLMATGTPVEATSWPKPSQMKVSITTALKDGDRQVILFDNVKTSMDDESLEAILTSRLWTDRRFHSQESIRLPNNVLWLFTKNNPTVSPDMLRRLVLVSLDPNKSPAVWNPKVLAEARAERQRIRTALVILIRYWAEQGAKAGSVSISGFEAWSESVSGILEAAGIEGFMKARADTQSHVYTEDEDVAEMISRIGRVMGTTELWTAADLWNAANNYDTFGTMTDIDRRAISEWLSGGQGTNKAMTTGRKLSGLVEQRLSGSEFVITKTSAAGNKGKYKVLFVADDGTKAPIPGLANTSKSDVDKKF